MKSALVALAILGSASVSSATYITTQTTVGCGIWTYSAVASGYICSSPGLMIQVPSPYDIQNAITALEMKNQQLELRIRTLESKVP